MKELIDRISSYQLFNYLLPGIIFLQVLSRFTPVSALGNNIVIDFFMYYFAGLIVSRVGSIIIEPMLEFVNFVKYEDYENFLSASKVDPGIAIILETNNTYRSLTGAFVLLTIIKIYIFLSAYLNVLSEFEMYVAFTVIFLLFLFSYKKQTKLLVKRIIATNKPT